MMSVMMPCVSLAIPALGAIFVSIIIILPTAISILSEMIVWSNLR